MYWFHGNEPAQNKSSGLLHGHEAAQVHRPDIRQDQPAASCDSLGSGGAPAMAPQFMFRAGLFAKQDATARDAKFGVIL